MVRYSVTAIGEGQMPDGPACPDCMNPEQWCLCNKEYKAMNPADLTRRLAALARDLPCNCVYMGDGDTAQCTRCATLLEYDAASKTEVQPPYVKCANADCQTMFGGFAYGEWPKLCPDCQDALRSSQVRAEEPSAEDWRQAISEDAARDEEGEGVNTIASLYERWAAQNPHYAKTCFARELYLLAACETFLLMTDEQADMLAIDAEVGRIIDEFSAKPLMSAMAEGKE